MEEEIKKIKSVLEDKDTKFWIGTNGIQTIENILNRLDQLEKELEPIYKLGIPVETLVAEYERLENIEDDREQLKEEKAELKRMLQRRIKYTQELEQDLFENCSNYVVPKSVIRDKIDNLQNYKGLVMYEKYNYEAIIRYLKELLGEEE